MKKFIIIFCLFLLSCGNKIVVFDDICDQKGIEENIIVEKTCSIEKKIKYLSKGDVPEGFIEAIKINSEKYFIEEDYLIAISYKESKFKKFAKNRNKHSFDFGLFQLNSSYHKENYEVTYQTKRASEYLKFCLENNKDTFGAIASYNAGLTGYKLKGNGINYAKDVMKIIKKLKRIS